MRIRDKKGQLAVFVVIAIAIVVILLIVFSPQLGKIFVPAPIDIQIEDCLREDVDDIMQEAISKGGSLDPELYYIYQDNTFEYLCYTNGWYERCVMQKPLLKQSIEEEVEIEAQSKVDSCIKELEDRLESKGYVVTTSGTRKLEVNIVPNKVIVSLDVEISLERDETKRVIDIPKTEFYSEADDLIIIASSILNWEARYGDSAPETYMTFYPDIRVEKKKQSDGTTAYIITHRETEEVMRFASRSVAWPPGAVPRS